MAESKLSYYIRIVVLILWQVARTNKSLALRVVHMEGVLSSIYWTIRSWLWNYPITQDFGLWNEGDPADLETWMNNRKRILHTWHFLHPFFISHGYNPYVHKDPKAFCSPLISSTKRNTADALFPFAQYCCQDESQLEFDFSVSAMLFLLSGCGSSWCHSCQLSRPLCGLRATRMDRMWWSSTQLANACYGSWHFWNYAGRFPVQALQMSW